MARRLKQVLSLALLVYLGFGGNAEAVSGNAGAFRRGFPDHTRYLVNYRGYGGSSGRPSEEGLYQAALTDFFNPDSD